MNVNVYLPDELGKRAKAVGLPLSRLLQRSVQEELGKMESRAATLEGPQTFELALAIDGHQVMGRLTGARIAGPTRKDIEVFLTEDERILLYDGAAERYFVVNDPVEQLRDALDEEAYFEAMDALGETPTIDL